jgi:hypothetical protein
MTLASIRGALGSLAMPPPTRRLGQPSYPTHSGPDCGNDPGGAHISGRGPVFSQPYSALREVRAVRAATVRERETRCAIKPANGGPGRDRRRAETRWDR